MTQYVRGLNQDYRERWLNLIGSELIPVKDGNPKLRLRDRILGRRDKAYYILDADALDYSTHVELVNRLVLKYGVSEQMAEKMVKEYKIPARLVEKVDKANENTCPVCGFTLTEKGLKFCPSCGSRLHTEQMIDKIPSAEAVAKPLTASQPVVETSSESGSLEVMQVQREETMPVSTEDIAVKTQEFKIVWSKVLLFLEDMHKTFNLSSITFSEDGKAIPTFKTRRGKRTRSIGQDG